MSTKTSFKRVSAIAALALAVGGFTSITAANAADMVGSSPKFTVSSAYLTGSGTSANTGSQIVGGVATVSFTETTTSTAALGSSPSATLINNIVSTGVGSIAGISSSNNLTDVLAGTTATSAIYPTTSLGLASSAIPTVGASISFLLTSNVAGTQTITANVIGANGVPTGTTATATITWLTTAASASVQYTQIGTATSSSCANFSTTPLTKASSLVVAADQTKLQAAYILVAPYDSNNNSLPNEKLGVTISGPGTLSIATAFSALSGGRSLTGVAGAYQITVFPDNVAGNSTVTITDGSVTLGTVAVTFTGSAKKVTATQNHKVLMAGGVVDYDNTNAKAGHLYAGPIGNYYATMVLTDGVAAYTTASKDVPLAPIVVHTTDSLGAPVTISVSTSTIKVVVSDPTVLTAGHCTAVTDSGSSSVTNEINCAVSGTVNAVSGSSATATVELYNSSTAAWDIVAAPLTFTIGGAVTKEVVTTDASNYVPNQPMTVTATATDASGNAAYDQDGSAIATAKSSTYMNGLVTAGNLPAMIVGGVGTSTGIYAPLVEGDFTISGVDGYSAAGEAVSVTATVAGFTASTASNAAADAAAEATDAANAATDAANAAADSADQATAAAQDAGSKADAALAAVTALSQQVTTLLSKIAALTAAVAKIAKKVKA